MLLRECQLLKIVYPGASEQIVSRRYANELDPPGNVRKCAERFDIIFRSCAEKYQFCECRLFE